MGLIQRTAIMFLPRNSVLRTNCMNRFELLALLSQENSRITSVISFETGPLNTGLLVVSCLA